MESLKFEISMKKIKEGFISAAEDLFKSSYSNPLKDVMTEAFKDKAGDIRKIIDSIVTEAITGKEFKEKISEVVIQNMVKAALNNK